MSSELQVRLTEKSRGEETWWEGTVSIAGLQDTRLVKKLDQSYKFSTKSAVQSAARRVATSLNFSGVVWDTPKVKTAAKRSVRNT